MVASFESRPLKAAIWLMTAIGLAIIYLPPLYLVAVSFNPALQPALPALSDVSLTWYFALAKERTLISALQESLLVATITALVATGLALLSALAYMDLGKWRSRWFMFVLLPMFVPGIIQGLSLSVIFGRIGLKPFWGTVAASHLLWALPFAFTVILTSMAAVRRSYLLAASDLGASWWRQLVDVTLPLIKPGLVAAFIFSFLLSLNEFGRAFYLVGRQNTLPLAMFGKMNSGASPTIYALSGSIFLASILAVSFVLLAARANDRKLRR
ncbi:MULTISPECIES: ABC transporter permease [Aminobacter]|uniref:ABC transporter permease n=1 Tax=Aminobacter TaxID=31988 RepID=UPI000D36B8E3|nr:MULTISPECIES: ABC transporter permease [Aminobacter]AWC24516.1 Inner membrane ABC transporter permease protein YdcV [Aminobacter sp. MSH1]CAI2935293.1 Inner membrane ABC transporter permease protein YdcV [Aminobacter niigataensis]